MHTDTIKQVDTSHQRSSISPEKYKKKLLAQVITIFIICLIIILERVFYQIIINLQEKVMPEIQESAGLTNINEKGEHIPIGIKNGFFYFFGTLSEFPIIFLLLTHYLATIFVGFDAILATKLLYVSMSSIYVISVLQMFYTGSRPFWEEKNILSSKCLPSYNHPSLGFILIMFIPIYTYYCWRQNFARISSKVTKKHIFIFILCGLIILVVEFLNFLIGTMYLINIVMSIVICLLLLMVCISMDGFINKQIRKSTIFKLEAKKHAFYILLLICLLATFVFFIYSGENPFLDIDWVQNFMSCTRYLEYNSKTYRFDEVIGPWFNFIQTSVLEAWVGAVFGIGACFREIENIKWAGGNLKNRILRIIIANIFIIPSWIFIIFIQGSGEWIAKIGLNIYLVDAIHFLILYLWIFGFMPILILHRLLQITSKQQSDFYMVMEEPLMSIDK